MLWIDARHLQFKLDVGAAGSGRRWSRLDLAWYGIRNRIRDQHDPRVADRYPEVCNLSPMLEFQVVVSLGVGWSFDLEAGGGIRDRSKARVTKG